MEWPRYNATTPARIRAPFRPQRVAGFRFRLITALSGKAVAVNAAYLVCS
jgi:hypothetical protein